MQGISLEKFPDDAPFVKTIDVFQPKAVEFSSLAAFPGIREASLVQAPKVSSLTLPPGSCPLLQQLWVTQCCLTSMAPVSAFGHLTTLVLDGNRITTLDGLDSLPRLTRLWVNDNRLTSLEGLAAAPSLKDVSLARNRLQSVHAEVEACTSLESLSLAGNRIGHFQDLLPFKRLPNLRELSMADPHWGKNPVCSLSNYRTFALYHLTQLQALDAMHISQAARAGADSTFVKKAMYYHMRIKMLKRNTAAAVRRARFLLQKYTRRLLRAAHPLQRQRHAVLALLAEQWLGASGAGQVLDGGSSEGHAAFARAVSAAEACAGAAEPWDEAGPAVPHTVEAVEAHPLGAVEGALRALSQARSDVAGAVSGLPAPLSKPARAEIAAKLAALDGMLALRSRQLYALRQLFLVLQERLQALSHCHVSRLMLELNTGGNIRFEDGRPSDAWFKSCVELLRSRFYKQDFAQLGVRGLRVQRVTRIHNRHLRTRFDARMAQVVAGHPELAAQLARVSKAAKRAGSSGDSSSSGSSKSKRGLEYLFYTPPWSGSAGAVGAREEALAQCQRIGELGFQARHAEVEAPVLPLVEDVNHAVPVPQTFAPAGKRFYRQKSAREEGHLKAAAAAHAVFTASARLESRDSLLRRGGLAPQDAEGTSLSLSACGIPFTNSLTCCDYPRLAHAVATALTSTDSGWKPTYPAGYAPLARESGPSPLAPNSSAAAAALTPSIATAASRRMYSTAVEQGPFDLSASPSSQFEGAVPPHAPPPRERVGVLGGVTAWNTAAGLDTQDPRTRYALEAAVRLRHAGEEGDPAVLSLGQSSSVTAATSEQGGKEDEGGGAGGETGGRTSAPTVPKYAGVPLHDPRVCEGVLVVSKVFLGMCALPEFAAGAAGQYMQAAVPPRDPPPDPPAPGMSRAGARPLTAADVSAACQRDGEGFDPEDGVADTPGGDDAPPPPVPVPLHSVMQCCADDARQKQWVVMDPALALPEYIIEFEYVWGGGAGASDPAQEAQDIDATVAAELAVLAGGGGAPRSGAPAPSLPHQEEADLRPVVRPLAAFLQVCRSTVASSDALARALPAGPSGMPSMLPPMPNHAEQHLAPAALAALSALRLPPPAEALVSGVTSTDGSLGRWVLQGILTAASGASRLYGAQPTPPLHSLAYLNLSGVGLRSLSVGAEQGADGEVTWPLDACPGLRVLDLSFNALSSLPAGAMWACQALVRLDLSCNALEHIERGALGGDGEARSSGPGASLQVLNLKGNALQTWADLEEVQHAAGYLQELDLRDNPITELSQPLPLRNHAPWRGEPGSVAASGPTPLLTLTLAKPSGLGAGDAAAGAQYRPLVVKAFPHLRALDGMPVSPRDKVGAASGARHITPALAFACGLDALGDPVHPPQAAASSPTWPPASPAAPRRTAWGAESPTSAGGGPRVLEDSVSPVAPSRQHSQAWLSLHSLDVSRQQLQSLAPSSRHVPPLEALDAAHAKVTELRGRVPRASDAASPRSPAPTADQLSTLRSMARLRRLDASFNDLQDLRPLCALQSLDTLILEGNAIQDLTGIGKLTGLTQLDLGRNYIGDAALAAAGPALARLEHLSQLSLEDNCISDLTPISGVASLVELYMGQNALKGLGQIMRLRSLPRLIILDLAGNPLASVEEYRPFTVYHLKRIKVLDGLGVDAAEATNASDRFAGRLTREYLEDKVGAAAFPSLRELDLSGCRIRKVDPLHPTDFRCLAVVNLAHNALDGHALIALRALPHLSVLRLNKNRVTSLTAVFKTPPTELEANLGVGPGHTWFRALEVLQLGHNGITDMAALHLSSLPSLKVLSLVGNDISRISGLEGCMGLRELALTNNRLRALDMEALAPLVNLAHLHIGENALRGLAGVRVLTSLQSLTLTSNRIPDLSEVGHLAALPLLKALHLGGNPVTRKPQYRVGVVKRMDLLETLDDVPVTDEEKAEAEAMFYAEQRAAGILPPGAPDAPSEGGLTPTPNPMPPVRGAVGLPGSTSAGLRVTPVELGAGHVQPTVVAVGALAEAQPRTRRFLRAGAGVGGGASDRLARGRPGGRASARYGLR